MLRTCALVVGLAVGLIAASGTMTGWLAASEIEIGSKAPEFSVAGIDGKKHSLESLSQDGHLVVLCFTCNNCPVAVAYEDRFIAFAKAYQNQKVTFVAINSNNQTEDLAAMKKRAKDKGFDFIYAFDETGQAAAAYQAKVTPELFIIQNGRVAYHGAFDDKQKEPSKHYVVDAVNSLLAGQAPAVNKTKPFGCGIKKKS